MAARLKVGMIVEFSIEEDAKKINNGVVNIAHQAVIDALKLTSRTTIKSYSGWLCSAQNTLLPFIFNGKSGKNRESFKTVLKQFMFVLNILERIAQA